MIVAACPRLFEVEARHDGRLTGTELASFERHMASCAACSGEAAELEALGQPLRADLDSGDELHARRERIRLLAAFNQALMRPERSFRLPNLLFVAAGLALLITFWLVFRRPQASESRSALAVRADSAAVWSERTDSAGKKLIIERGALWIHVDPSARTGPLLVVLPDGELEDTGTTFTVSVEDGRTTRVAVEDGSVVLRIRGQPPVALDKGESWIPEIRAPTPAPERSLPSASPPAGRRPQTRPSADAVPIERRSPATPSAPMRTAPVPSAVAPAVSAPTPASSAAAPLTDAAAPLADPSADFRAAMALLNGGSNTEAAAAFASFLARYPADRRAEDAAYMRIIALQRSGNASAMKDAARAYLRRHPNGFRRAEAEKLSR